MKGSCVLYGDVNLNIIDGSAIWLVSMARVLSTCFEDVHLLLKAPPVTSRLLEEIEGIAKIHVTGPSGEEQECTPRVSAQRIAGLVAKHQPRAVIARGRRVCAYLANSTRLKGLLWAYMTDVPHSVTGIDDKTRADIDHICAASFRLFAQTEDARAFLESQFPSAAGKTLLLPPMIPSEELDAIRAAGEVGAKAPRFPEPGAPLRLGYAGKFAKSWMTREMCELPGHEPFAGRVNLDLVGDKFQNDPGDRRWSERMRAAVELPGVNWCGGLSRLDSMRVIAGCDLALSFRAGEMDSVHELSTKVLEYCAVGVPPVINKNLQHVELFGEDYPLYVNDGDYEDVIRRVLEDPLLIAEARKRLPAIASRFSIEAARTRLRETFAGGLLEDIDEYADSGEPLRVLVAGHDFKFCGELIDGLSVARGIDLRIDKWTALAVHDEAESRRLLEWADVIVCEWCGPNAVWYSQHKRPRQRLIVRLHRFELGAPWLKDVEFEKVDRLVCVSQHIVDTVRDLLPEIADRLFLIPNTVDCCDLNRPKAPGSQFHLAIIGVTPILKRLDRALDLIAALVRRDRRFTLHIKGRYPSEYPWLWRDAEYHEYFSDCYHRIFNDPEIRDHIVLDYFSPDVANWLRGIGWVLSPSTEESFHLAPAEGMASGAVPVIWDRPGAAGTFGQEWIVEDSADRIAEFIGGVARDEQRFHDLQERAVAAIARYDRGKIIATWFSLIFARV